MALTPDPGHEPLKRYFLWLVAEVEVRELQSVRRAQLEEGSLLMRWRYHRGVTGMDQVRQRGRGVHWQGTK